MSSLGPTRQVSADEAKMHRDLAKLKEDDSQSEALATKARDEIQRLETENSSLKEETRQWPER